MRIEFGFKPEEFTKAAVKVREFQYQRPDTKVTLFNIPKDWTEGVVLEKDVNQNHRAWGKKKTHTHEEQKIKNRKTLIMKKGRLMICRSPWNKEMLRFPV